MVQKKIDQSNTYRIRLKGLLTDRSAADWFGDMAILLQANDETLLVGQFVDQSALRGFMEQLWNLNFTVLSVESIENENHQDPDFYHLT